MDVVALVIFLGVIILAFVRKINVGILAVAAGVIAVRLFGMTDKDLIGGFSTSMFTTLVGITLLFAAITQTGALDLLARKIIALAGTSMSTMLSREMICLALNFSSVPRSIGLSGCLTL